MSERIMSQFLKSAARAFSRHMKTFLFMGMLGKWRRMHCDIHRMVEISFRK